MSVFNCNITYRRVEGDSYRSTYNRLLSQGFIDSYLNVKDVAKFRSARKELNTLASNKLDKEVSLFEEKKLLSGIRAVPNMKVFGMIDAVNNKIATEANAPVINNDVKSIYETMNLQAGAIPSNRLAEAQRYIDEYNQLNTGKILSLLPVFNGLLVQTTFQSNYLYNVAPVPESIPEKFMEEDSNSDFNKPCL